MNQIRTITSSTAGGSWKPNCSTDWAIGDSRTRWVALVTLTRAGPDRQCVYRLGMTSEGRAHLAGGLIPQPDGTVVAAGDQRRSVPETTASPLIPSV